MTSEEGNVTRIQPAYEMPREIAVKAVPLAAAGMRIRLVRNNVRVV